MAGAAELMSPLSQAATMKVALPTAGVTAGDIALLGDVYGFVFATLTEAEVLNSTLREDDGYTVVYEAQVVSATKDGSTIDQGKVVYWDATSLSETQATGAVAIGVCVEAAAAADGTVKFRLDGNLAN